MNKLLITTVIVGVSAGAAWAEGPRGAGGPGLGAGPMGDVSFAELDADGDGALSIDELTAQAQSRFDGTDTNGDGALSADEIAAAIIARATEAAPQMAENMIAHLDDNADGVLQAEEITRPMPDPERMFDRVDTDNDEAISQAEWDEMRAQMQERMQKRGERGERGDHERRGFFGFGRG